MQASSQYHPRSSRVLIASDNAADASQILERLEAEFPLTRVSTDLDQVLDETQSFAPSVLLLAFRRLEDAERLVATLRQGQKANPPNRRCILLCNKEDVPVALELCKSGAFDDYVLYWPQAQDGLRLIMAVWNAALQVSMVAAGPTKSDLTAHVGHLDALQALLDGQWSETAHLSAAAQGAVGRAERAVADALAHLQQLMAAPRDREVAHGNSVEFLNGEFNRFRAVPIAREFRAAAAAVDAVDASARRSRERLVPVLAHLHTMANKLSRRRAVLVVDDDPFARTLAQKALEKKGYAVIFAENSGEAVDVLQRVRPDAILMDVNLPGMDGVALTAWLKSQPDLAGIPVLMLTGEARRETLGESLQAGACEFIVKPFTPEGLVAKLESSLLRAGNPK
jgi:CheY-like chemotaxis protein